MMNQEQNEVKVIHPHQIDLKYSDSDTDSDSDSEAEIEQDPRFEPIGNLSNVKHIYSYRTECKRWENDVKEYGDYKRWTNYGCEFFAKRNSASHCWSGYIGVKKYHKLYKVDIDKINGWRTHYEISYCDYSHNDWLYDPFEKIRIKVIFTTLPINHLEYGIAKIIAAYAIEETTRFWLFGFDTMHIGDFLPENFAIPLTREDLSIKKPQHALSHYPPFDWDKPCGLYRDFPYIEYVLNRMALKIKLGKIRFNFLKLKSKARRKKNARSHALKMWKRKEKRKAKRKERRVV